MNGRFLQFAPISYVSPQNPCRFDPIYHDQLTIATRALEEWKADDSLKGMEQLLQAKLKREQPGTAAVEDLQWNVDALREVALVLVKIGANELAANIVLLKF